MGERDGIIETEKVIYSEDGKTKIGVVKEHFAKVTKRCSDRVESTVSICSLKVTWWFYGYLNDG